MREERDPSCMDAWELMGNVNILRTQADNGSVPSLRICK
jgi:hypothetical protein